MKTEKKEEQKITKQKLEKEITKEKNEETILEKILRIFTKYFEWTHLVGIIFGLILLHYYVKFKRIYDEY